MRQRDAADRPEPTAPDPVGAGAVRAAGADAVVIAVRAQPGAARREVVGYHGDALRLRVGAPADRGRANRELADLLAAALGVPRGAVALERGATGRDKTFRVDGIDVATARARLGAILAGGAGPEGGRGRQGRGPAAGGRGRGRPGG